MARNVKRIVFYVLIVVTIIIIINVQLKLRTAPSPPPSPKSVAIYDQEEMEFAFDGDIGNEYFRTKFDARNFSGLELIEYLKWTNENACPEHQDFGGVLDYTPKVHLTSSFADLDCILTLI